MLQRLKLQVEAHKKSNPPTAKGNPRRANENAELFRQQELTPEALIEDLNNSPAGVSRGIAAVRRVLERIAQSNSERESAGAKFGLWLLDNNPGLANDLAITAKDMGDNSGSYNPLKMIASLNTKGFSTNTIVHEIMHHAERMLPVEIQDKIRGEYAGRFINKQKQVAKAGREEAMAFLEAVVKYNTDPTDANKQEVLKYFFDGILKPDEFYKYISPSEYWAETASEILARKHSADSWIAKAKEWLREFAEHVKDFLKLDSNAEVYLALRGLADTTGKQQSSDMINESDSTVQDIRDADEDAGESDPFQQSEAEADAEAKVLESKGKEAKGVSTFQRHWENLSNHVLAFEEGIIELNKKGGVSSYETDPSRTYRTYNGEVSYKNDMDFKEVVEPVKEWIEQNWAYYADTADPQFIDKLNRFFGNTNFLERIETYWLDNVALSKGRELDRVNIIEDMLEGTLKPEEARLKLRTLVTKYATKTVDEHAIDSGVRPAVYEALTTKLKELDEELGINQESMADLNKLLDAVRGRQRQRLIESGQVSKDDPWIDFYGWKWYVPLKGVAAGAVDIASQNAFDLTQDKLSLAKLSKQMEAMEGRKTFGQRPFERLFVDLARAGERSAHHGFTESLYELMLDNQELLGAKIAIFKGTPRNGYVRVGDTENTLVNKLPKPKGGVGFIHNDGDLHYIVSLPKSSQIARGLSLMNAVHRPGALTKFVSKGTNFLARMYTTASPTWQTATGFVREFTTLPFTIGAENFDSPIQAKEFLAGFYGQVGTMMKALPTMLPTIVNSNNATPILGANKTVQERAAADSDSYSAWLMRWLEAGGANNFTQGFELEGVNKIFSDSAAARLAKLNNAEGLVGKTSASIKVAGLPVKWLLEYTGNYANFLEQIPRTAAFKTLVEMGLSDKEAAIKVRQVLDYQQTGIYGRSVNSWIAFFRIAMTSIDTIRRAFRNRKTGGVDWPKVRNWMGSLSGLSMATYFMVAAMMGDDDDGEERIKQVRANTLTQKFIIPTGSGAPIAIPIGLGLPQLLMAPGVLTAAWMNGHITYDEAVKEMYETIMRNGPVMSGGIKETTPTNIVASAVLGATPTVAAPLLSLERNTDAFDRSIHSDFKDDSKYKYTQGRASTGKLYKETAKAIHDWTGIDYFPEDIKYLMISYGGQNVADLLKGTVDRAAREEIGTIDQFNPIVARFVVQDEKYYDQENMYKTMGEAKDIRRRYNSIKSNAEEHEGLSKSEAAAKADAFLKKTPGSEDVLKALRALEKANKERSKAIKAIKADKATSATRKEFLRKDEDRKMKEATKALTKALEEVQ
jgi:hypothetical protein